MGRTELAIPIKGKLLDISLKDDITPAEAKRVIYSACDSLYNAETSAAQARRMIGRLLVDIENRKLYAPEFRIFEDFLLDTAEKKKLSRPTLRNAMMEWKRLPDLSIKEIEAIPATSLTLLARAAINADHRQMKKLVEEAQRESYTRFREVVMGRNFVGRPGRPDAEHSSKTTNLRIQIGRAVSAKWKILVGERTPGAVFAELVNEAFAAVQQKKAA